MDRYTRVQRERERERENKRGVQFKKILISRATEVEPALSERVPGPFSPLINVRSKSNLKTSFSFRTGKRNK